VSSAQNTVHMKSAPSIKPKVLSNLIFTTRAPRDYPLQICLIKLTSKLFTRKQISYSIAEGSAARTSTEKCPSPCSKLARNQDGISPSSSSSSHPSSSSDRSPSRGISSAPQQSYLSSYDPSPPSSPSPPSASSLPLLPRR
jgi:hypothetical protein